MDTGSNEIKIRLLVRRIRRIALIVGASAISFLGIVAALYFHLIPGVEFVPPKIDAKYLVTSMKSGSNTVDIYQQKDQVCVDFHSTSPADIPHQICVPASHPISRSDITLHWFVYNGNLEEVAASHPNTALVHIIIKDKGKVILDHKESFIEKLLNAFDEGVKQLPSPVK